MHPPPQQPGQPVPHGYPTHPPGYPPAGVHPHAVPPGKLTPCKHCGAAIAKVAKSCPHCGAKNKQGPGLVVGAIVAAVATCGVCVSLADEESRTSSAADVAAGDKPRTIEIESAPVAPPAGEAPSSPDSIPSKTSRGSNRDVAADLGLDTKGRDNLSTIARRFGVEERVVGDKAAKAAELCMSPKPVSADPTRAATLVRASLEFVVGASGSAADREMLALDDEFVTFVAMGCPTG